MNELDMIKMEICLSPCIQLDKPCVYAWCCDMPRIKIDGSLCYLIISLMLFLQPNDIKAAEYGGALAVGVCTGIFTEAELKKASSGTAIILPDLTDSKAFMKLLGIKICSRS